MIVVAGEALVDLIVRADGSIAAIPGGGPYNAARAVGRLGVPVAWLGGLSSDRFGRTLEAGLVADGVSTSLVQRTDAPTTLALAELDGTGAASYRFYTQGTAAAELLPGPSAALPAGTRAVHAGTLGFVLEPMATTLEGLIATLPEEVLLLVDPNCRPSITRDADGYRARMTRILERADIVKASTEDLAFLVPGADPTSAARWVASLGARAVVVTDGGEAVRVRVGDERTLVQVPTIEVVDTVGAGDTFGGAALAALVHAGVTRTTLDTAAIVRATRFGVRAAAFACTRAGADPPTLDELGGWPA
ncbi:MAG TPA: carbohydrate kinase [Candidatus Limnocylindrales bacterium]